MDSIKKIMALIMAVLLTATVFACSGNNSGGEASPSPSTASSPNDSETSSPPSDSAASSQSPTLTLSQQGYYDPDKDYFSRDPYKIAMLIQSTPTSMHQSMIKSYSAYGPILNYTMQDISANDDADYYINLIETTASQDYDGYFLDFHQETKDRVLEVATELKLIWLPGLSSYTDDDGKLLYPASSADSYKYGGDMTVWLDQEAKNMWGDFDQQKLGMVGVNYTLNSDIKARVTGAYDKFKELYPDIADTNYWEADGASHSSFTADTAYNLVSAIISAHPDIEYWIIASSMDDYANGAARAAEAANKQDKTIVIATGGIALVSQWDEGNESCWKACIYYDTNLGAKTICAALMSLIDGDTTPETLWPQWVAPGEKYARLLKPWQLLTYDMYQDFFSWVDRYTGLDNHDYPDNGVDFEFDITGGLQAEES